MEKAKHTHTHRLLQKEGQRTSLKRQYGHALSHSVIFLLNTLRNNVRLELCINVLKLSLQLVSELL